MINDDNVKKKIRIAKFVRNSAITLICIILGIVIAFEYKSVKNNLSNGEENQMSVEDYQAKIIALSESIDMLERQKNELEKKVETFENSTNEERIEELEKENEQLRAYSCLTEVKAEGVVITLNYTDSADISGSSYLILNLINELKASDAQAVSVNGERIHAMSEVRAVNDTLVINGNSHYAPISISVVGDATKLISAINMSGIKKSLETYFAGGRGQFAMEYSREVSIPALTEEYLQSIMNYLK